MRYFIAYTLDGETKTAHEKLTNEIADTFDVFRLSGYIPPHITLKYPFEAKEINDIEQILASFSLTHNRAPIKIHGFGSFDEETIFTDVLASAEAENLIQELMDALRTIPWLLFEKFDWPKKLHSTVGRHISKEIFSTVWSFVKEKQFDFDLYIDNVSILKKEGAGWVMHKKYSLLS